MPAPTRRRLERDGNMVARNVVAGGESLPVGWCSVCGADVALARSTRTGRSYLCEVYRSAAEHGARRAYPFKPHDCEPVLARRAEWSKQQRELEEREAAARARLAAKGIPWDAEEVAR